MKQRLVFIAATCAAVSPIVSAQEMTLDPVVVTASRTPQTADEALASVTVITREDIERRPSQSVVELLRGTPGVSVINQGGAGKVSNIFMRGTESDHVLVMIDGIKIGGATAAGIPWHDLPADQIERIEIVRGPRSSLYGSEAIGGVIQIFTRKGGGQVSPSVSVGAGSDNAHKTNAQLSGGGERGWFSLGLSHSETDGFDACNSPNGCYADEPDNDGYRNTSVQARLGTRFGQSGEADFSALRAEGRNEFDGARSWANGNDFVQQVYSGRLALAPTRNWRATFIAGVDDYDRDYLLDRSPIDDRLKTTRQTLSWQNDLALSETQLLTLGLDYQKDEVEASDAYGRDSRDNHGVFAQHQSDFGRHSLQLALRHDDNEHYGTQNTGNLAWGYDISDRLRTFVSYGTAFKAPTFDDLYGPWGGNPDLRPEESRSVELGLQGGDNTDRWTLSLFRTDIDELIAYRSATPYNIEEARILGLEASASTVLAGWTVGGNVTLLDPENRATGASYGNVLPRRARRSAKLDIDRDFGAYSLGASAFVAGKRYDDVDNNLSMGGYGLIDLRAGYQMAKDWRLQAEVTNLFDKSYETSRYYNQAGRRYFLTLRYAPTN